MQRLNIARKCSKELPTYDLTQVLHYLKCYMIMFSTLILSGPVENVTPSYS